MPVLKPAPVTVPAFGEGADPTVFLRTDVARVSFTMRMVSLVLQGKCSFAGNFLQRLHDQTLAPMSFTDARRVPFPPLPR